MPKQDRRSESYKPTRAEMSRLMGGDVPSTAVSSGLEFTHPGERQSAPAPRAQTADEIRAEARARDPESWDRVKQGRREKVGDDAELHARRMDEAIADEDDALIIARGRAWAQADPASWEQFLAEQDEFYLEQRDEMGYDPDTFEETELPSFTLGSEVDRSIQQEHLSRRIAETSAEIQGIEQASLAAFRSRLRAEGIEPNADDQSSIDYYQSLTHWIALSTGVHPSELVNDGKGDRAAELVVTGHRQLAQYERDTRVQEWKSSIHNAEDGSIAGGLETGTDRTAAELSEIKNLLRDQNGLDRTDAVPVPEFDPEFEYKPTQEETFDPTVTVGEFRESLHEEEPASLKSADAFTVGGLPSSLEEVTRDLEAEERTARESRIMEAKFSRP
jgi:hypothetical protein